MSTATAKLCSSIALAAALFIGLAHPTAARAQDANKDLPAGSVVLWSWTLPHGGWRPFGNGMEDSAISDGGLLLAVSWTESKWGVGSIYPDPSDSYATPLPSIASFHKLRLEVRASVADKTTVSVELGRSGQDGGARPIGKLIKPVSADWQTLEFDIPASFQDITPSDLRLVNVLHILYLNDSRTGANKLQFRNVTLIP